MPKIYKKHTLNEALPGIVGGSTAEVNGKPGPSADMIKNVETSSPGGTDSIVNDAHRGFDWINGNGVYGVAGRDFSYSISSLALVNPLAAGAVIGTIGAGAMVYGIMTSAYVRSKQTIRRLKKIYRGVVGPKGYALGTTNWLFFGLFSNIGGDEGRIGVVPFFKEIDAEVKHLLAEATNSGITVQTLGTMSPKILGEKQPAMDHILTQSYINFYIPQEEIQATQTRYEEYMKNKYFRIDKNTAETYESIVKKAKESTVNAPIIAKKDNYLKQIDDLGLAQVNAFDTKMGYALKRGGNRATSCSQKIHKLWAEMMKKIGAEFDKKIADTFSTSNKDVVNEMVKLRQLIDAIYKVRHTGLTYEALIKEISRGSIYMQRNATGNKAPIMLRVNKVSDSGKVEMTVVNTDIASNKPLKSNISQKKLMDGINYSRMIETLRPTEIQKGRWYTINYRGASTFDGGYWKSYVYVEDIYNSPVYGGEMVCYSYANIPYPKKGGGVVYNMQKDKFVGLVLGEILEEKYIKAPTVAKESVKYDNTNKLFEADEDEQSKADSEENATTEPSTEDSAKTNGDDNKKEANKPDKPDTSDEDTGIASELIKYAFTNKSVYILFNTENRDCVATNAPLPGKVSLREPYEGKTEMSYEEWCEYNPVEMPFMMDELGEMYSANRFLDDPLKGDKELKFPLKYGVFAANYVTDNNEICNSVLRKHIEELRHYALKYDSKAKRYVGLYETSGNMPATSIAYFKNFNDYLRRVIYNEIFLEKEPEEDNNSEENLKKESIDIEELRKLFEATKITDKSQVGDNINNSQKKTQDNRQETHQGDEFTSKTGGAESGDGGAAVSGNGNQVVINNNYGMTLEQFAQIIMLIKSGAIGIPEQNIKKDNGGNIIVPTQDDSETITDIPEIVKTVCLEIYKNSRSMNESIKKGQEQAKYTVAPQVFTAQSDGVDTILNNGVNEETGVEKIEPASTDSSVNNISEFKCEDENKEPVKLVKIGSDKEEGTPSEDSSVEAKSSDEKKQSLTFSIRDKLVTIKNKFSKALEQMHLSPNGFVKKGSDQEKAKIEYDAMVKEGCTYEVSKEWLDKSIEDYKNNGKIADSSTSESFFDNYDYTKLFEADDIEKSKETILVLIKSIDGEKIGIEYVINGEHYNEYLLPDAFAKSKEVNTLQYEFGDNFSFGSIYTIPASDFAKIENYITDKSKLEEIDGKYTFIAVGYDAYKENMAMNFGGNSYNVPSIDLYPIRESITKVTTFEQFEEDDKYFSMSYEEFEKDFAKFVEKEVPQEKEENTTQTDSSMNTQEETPKEVALHLVHSTIGNGDNTLEFEYKTDIDASNGVVPHKMKAISIFEMNTNISLKTIEKPKNWEGVEKTKVEDASIAQYPEEAKRFLTSHQSSQLQTLYGLLNNNPEGINKKITDYFNKNKNQYKDLDSIIAAINNEMVGKHKDDNDKVKYLMILIDALLGKKPMVNPEAMNNEPDKERWLVYIGKNNEQKKVPIKVKGVKGDVANIIIPETNKEYTVSLKDNKYAIVESAFNSFRVGYKSHEAYMKHILYNVPLNESLVFNVGSPEAIEKVLNVLIGKDDNALSLLYILKPKDNLVSQNAAPDNSQSQPTEPAKQNTNNQATPGAQPQQPNQEQTVQQQNQTNK